MTHHPAGAGKSSFDLLDGDQLLRTLALQPTSVLLDLGCGSGNYSIAAAAHINPPGAIHAVDLWPEGVAALSARARKEGLLQIQAHQADAAKRLPLADDSVDLCLMATVLHDLVDDDTHAGALAQIVRVLKAGGRLAVVEFEKIDGPPGPPRQVRLSPPETERLLAPYGFSAQQITNLNPDLYLAQYVLKAPSTERITP